MSGDGARKHGGRWNPPGFSTVYGSTNDTTALEECKARDRYYCVHTKTPRLLVAIEADVNRMRNRRRENDRLTPAIMQVILQAENDAIPC